MKYVVSILAVLTLAGCSSFEPRPPEPFILGDPTPPPIGCADLRKRNPKADC